jgi:hypothetical protein
MIPKFLRRRPTPADLPPVTVPPKPAPVPVPVAPRTAEPTPTPTPGPVFQPGRYVVTYGRMGQHGDRLTGLRRTPTPATFTVDSAADLAEQIRRDVAPWIGGYPIEVTVDTTVSGGIVRSGAVSGAFTFTRTGRADARQSAR